MFEVVKQAKEQNDVEYSENDKKPKFKRFFKAAKTSNRSLFIFSEENTIRKASRIISSSKYPFLF
jgi:hypothetical protein